MPWGLHRVPSSRMPQDLAGVVIGLLNPYQKPCTRLGRDKFMRPFPGPGDYKIFGLIMRVLTLGLGALLACGPRVAIIARLYMFRSWRLPTVLICKRQRINAMSLSL